MHDLDRTLRNAFRARLDAIVGAAPSFEPAKTRAQASLRRRRQVQSLSVAAGLIGLAATLAVFTIGPDGAGRASDPSGADQLVLRVEHTGGGGCIGTPCDYYMAPEVVILEDGLTIVPLSQEWAGALPPFRAVRVPEIVAELRHRAEVAGLAIDGDRPADPAAPQMAEAYTLKVTYRDPAGSLHVVTAYHLENEDVLTPDRERLLQFLDWLRGLIGEQRGWKRFSAPSARVTVLPSEEAAWWGPPRDPATLDWPLEPPIDRWGSEGPEFGRCAVIDGDDLRTLRGATAGVAGEVRWRGGSSTYVAFIDPQMPTEPLTC